MMVLVAPESGSALREKDWPRGPLIPTVILGIGKLIPRDCPRRTLRRAEEGRVTADMVTAERARAPATDPGEGVHVPDGAGGLGGRK